MSKIVSFVDASVYADSVCDHAAWVADKLQSDIVLVHVLGRREMSPSKSSLSGAIGANAQDTLLAELSASDEAAAKIAQKRGRVILETAKARLVAQGHSADKIESKLRIGDLVETLHQCEDDADLIVIGKRGEAADFAAMHLGSNIERVVRASRKPVLVTSRAFKPVRRVLIAYDGGASIDRAITYLAKTQSMFGSLEIKLLRAGVESDTDTRKMTAAKAQLQDVGYTVSAVTQSGQPDSVISDCVERDDFQLLIMGAYGHSRIRTLIIGSTTTQMIRSCKVPILLFR